MNPAYMIRQLIERHPNKYGVRGKITSLKYLWKGNAPDVWEKKALKKLEKGIEEISEYAKKIMNTYKVPIILQ